MRLLAGLLACLFFASSSVASLPGATAPHVAPAPAAAARALQDGGGDAPSPSPTANPSDNLKKEDELNQAQDTADAVRGAAAPNAPSLCENAR